MTYATQANLEARFGGEIADFLAGNAASVAQALADADAMIDGYLASYSLPLASVPPILTQYACDIARYRLYGDAAPEVVVNRHKDAIRFLERVAAGQIGLGVTGIAPVAGSISTNAPSRVFSADALDGL
jgi:phage gp36-like protein